MKHIKKIIFALVAVLSLSVFTVACEKEPTVSKEELVYPVDLKAELKDGVTYTADTPINLDDFKFTLIYNDGSEKDIPSSLVSDYATVSNENGEIKVKFTYVYDEDKLIEELKAEKKAEENKEELKANASTNWDAMTDAEKKVVWNDSSLSEKEEIVKVVYADEIASLDPIEGASAYEQMGVNSSTYAAMEANPIDPDDPYGKVAHDFSNYYDLDPGNSIWLACNIIIGRTTYDYCVANGANATDLANKVAKYKVNYFVNNLDAIL